MLRSLSGWILRSMTDSEYARKANKRNARLATALPVAIILMLDPLHLIPERLTFVAKIAAADETPSAVRDRTMPPARDPDIAVKEEYDIAVKQGSPQGLELFIARHPTSALADKARADLQRLTR